MEANEPVRREKILVQDAEPVPFTLEVFNDGLGHPDAPEIVQVNHVVHWFRGTPLA